MTPPKILKRETPDRVAFFNEFKTKWKVKHLMTPEVMVLDFEEHLNLADVTMAWRRFRHLPVVDAGRNLMGMVSHRDLMNEFACSTTDPEKQRKYASLESVAVKDVMIWNVETVSEDDSLAQAAQKMHQSKCGALPVLDCEKKVVGILTEADFVKLIHFGEKAFSEL